MAVEGVTRVSHKILRWYESGPRHLPWRLPPGQALPLSDPAWPYRVWLSEIMLQQTTVAAVKPYFEVFMKRWPTVHMLAAGDDSDVMAAWAGLGYYARARNLLACAREVVARYGGRFPDNEAALRSLPGIGAYTSSAIMAIAFGQRAVVVDGNVERVVARLFAINTPLPMAKPLFWEWADRLTPQSRPGDHAQAMMDLGATICTPKSPSCTDCPVNSECKGKLRWSELPVKPPKKQRPHRHGIAWWIEKDGEVFLIRRGSKRMLGDMRALPSDDWDRPKSVEAAPLSGGAPVATVEHVFTHFSLALEIRRIIDETGCTSELVGEWWPIDRLGEAGLPSLFAKAVQAVLMGE